MQFVTPNSVNYYILMLFESIFICAVDLFMIISGYFSCQASKTVLQKPIKLLVQVILFSFSWNLITGFAKGTLTIKGLIESAIPANYFVVLYIAVYLLSPYLNLLYEKINRNFVILVVVLFSVWPTIVEVFCQITGKEFNGLSTIGMYGSQWGYQIVNFILMYFIGMYIRKNDEMLKKIKAGYLISSFLATVVLITMWASISERCGFSRNMAWIYCSPLVIFDAALLFLLFSRLNIGCVKWINKLAGACFSVFLTHGYFIIHVKIEWAVQQNPVVMLGHILACSILIYLACFVIDIVYGLFYKILFKKFEYKDIVITQL